MNLKFRSLADIEQYATEEARKKVAGLNILASTGAKAVIYEEARRLAYMEALNNSSYEKTKVKPTSPIRTLYPNQKR